MGIRKTGTLAMRFLMMLCVTSVLISELAAQTSTSSGEKTIAGRTLAQYAAQMDDEHRVVRLIAVKSLGAFGVQADPVLVDALDHADPAVRYIAAVHLGRHQGDALKQAQKKLKRLADDSRSLAVRVAASFALCRAGLTDEYLPRMVDALQYPERGMVCSTAELIGGLGPDAAGATKPLEKLFEKNRPGVKGGDYHIGGAAQNALRKIHGEDERFIQE